MKTLYAFALALLLATTAHAQSHDNPVSQKAMESEIRKNERWRTFYDSLTPEEQSQFITWWRQQIDLRRETNPVKPGNTAEYKREYRQGLQQWYRDEVTSFEQKREMQERYEELWAKREKLKTEPQPTRPKKKTVINVIDADTYTPARGPRYYNR